MALRKGDTHDAELLANARARREGVVSRRNNPKMQQGRTADNKPTGLKRRSK